MIIDDSPFEVMKRAFDNLYPDFKVRIFYVPIVDGKKDVYGMVNRVEGNEFHIQLNFLVPYIGLTEVLCHEFAHIVLYEENEKENKTRDKDHDKVFEEVVDKLFQEFEKMTKEVAEKNNYELIPVERKM